VLQELEVVTSSSPWRNTSLPARDIPHLGELDPQCLVIGLQPRGPRGLRLRPAVARESGAGIKPGRSCRTIPSMPPKTPIPALPCLSVKPAADSYKPTALRWNSSV